MQFSDFADYFAKITISNQTEVGYALLNYVVSKFSNNINVFFFWLEFIIIFMFLWAAFRYESLFGISSVIQFVVFFGLFYGRAYYEFDETKCSDDLGLSWGIISF